MKNKRLILTSLIITVSIFSPWSKAEIIDIPIGWSKEAVTQAIDNNILNITNDSVRPLDMLTRAEMAYGIVNAFGATKQADMTGYIDVNKDTLYYDEISKAVAMGAISGYGNGKIKPEDTISREEMFAVLYNVLELEKGDLKCLDKFNDKELVSDWSKYIVARMVENGYVSGNAKGNIKAKEDITREEFAQVMKNIFATYYNETGTYTEIPSGTIVINTPGITLKDSIITGDLIISEGVGQGRVVLDNVTVLGRTIIRGGMNSIDILNGSKLSRVIVNNKNGKVVLYSQNSTIIEVLPKTGTMLKGTFAKVVINEKSSLRVLGTVENLWINQTADIELAEGKISNITVNKNAVGTSIIGVGTASKVLVNANNVTILNDNAEVIVSAGVEGTVSTGKVTYIGQKEEPKVEEPKAEEPKVEEPKEGKALTLSYNLLGGSGEIFAIKRGLKEDEISYEFNITNVIPTKNGYEFLGWSEEKNSTLVSYNPGDKITISRNKTLYAIWQIKKH